MGNNGAGWAQERRQDPGGIPKPELGSHPGISWGMFPLGKEPQGSGSSDPAQQTPEIPP